MTYKLSIKKVPKVWGTEEWITNGDYCGKILNVNRGYRCSIHYHKIKDEVLYLDNGLILFELDSGNGLEKVILNSKESVRVLPGQKHRFWALEKSRIIEFSTHHDDKDSYRDEVSGEFDADRLYQEMQRQGFIGGKSD